MIKLPLFDYRRMEWYQVQGVPTRAFTCGFCSTSVSSNSGFNVVAAPGQLQGWGIYICPNCLAGNIFDANGQQFPVAAIGKAVSNVPGGLNELYEEARRCTTSGCNTAAVLVCRKMLMNIAVTQGADEGLKFIEYVEYLSKSGYVPPNGKHWVDHIRRKGNEATHEIALMKDSDAKELLTFLEMLLRFIYEFPAMVPKSSKGSS